MSDISIWRDRLDTSLAKSEWATEFVQLATVRPDGAPAVRTVVFRAFVEPGSGLCFGTDLRSAKVEQIVAQPLAEACWYFPATREQYRITGRLEVARPDSRSELSHARERVWTELSEKARQVYSWPPPGEPLAAINEFTRPAPEKPPEPFGLLVLTPEQIDYLDVKANPHRRIIFQRSAGVWTAQPVNP